MSKKEFINAVATPPIVHQRQAKQELLLLLFLLLLIPSLGGCRKEPKEEGGTKHLIIQLAAHPTTRGIDKPIADDELTVSSYECIILKFWNEDGSETVYPHSLTFGVQSEEDYWDVDDWDGEYVVSDAMKALMGNGYEIEVPAQVKQISCITNYPVDSIIRTFITDYQGRGFDKQEYQNHYGEGSDNYNNFLHENFQESRYECLLPYVSSKVPLSSAQLVDGKYHVVLEPKPNVARLEISGVITPPKNKYGVSAFDEIQIDEVYLNNFILERDKGKRLCITMDDWDVVGGHWNIEDNDEIYRYSWYTGEHCYGNDGYYEWHCNAHYYPGQEFVPPSHSEIFPLQFPEFPVRCMSDDGCYDAHINGENGEVLTFYIFPQKEGEQDADHLIIRLSYGINDPVLGEGVANSRFITVRSFSEGTGDAKKKVVFEAGKIYRIDISSLSSIFKTPDDEVDDSGNPLYVEDPTDYYPEENYVELDGVVVVDPWQVVDIPVEM